MKQQESVSGSSGESRQVIEVYADWSTLKAPLLVGRLTYVQIRGSGVFSFAYDKGYLESEHAVQIDPVLKLQQGEIYNDNQKENFRAFLDSCPDRWGRVLMQKMAAYEAEQGLRKSPRVSALEYLLGVDDYCRKGALRFKLEGSDAYLACNERASLPTLSSLRDIEQAAIKVESGENVGSQEYYRNLSLLLGPGAALGGARPKACVVDEQGNLWIAKFPRKHDSFDVGAWEMVCHKLAVAAGIDMSTCEIRRLTSKHHTFLTKRFDRVSPVATKRASATAAMVSSAAATTAAEAATAPATSVATGAATAAAKANTGAAAAAAGEALQGRSLGCAAYGGASSGSTRLHFSSAMTQLKYYDGEDSEGASYLEIAEFLQKHSDIADRDLAQLWRRIVFNIAVSNTDDHLRNHGFILTDSNHWRLSPAYDLNPNESADGLHLNITDSSSKLDYALAFEIIDFFNLSKQAATTIYDEVLRTVQQWQAVATRIGISREEQLRKAPAFNV